MCKNENNRIHTGNVPCKAEFPIMDLLPEGRENAVSTKTLMSVFNCSERVLRAMVAAERIKGAVICSAPSGGYFRPGNREELLEFYRVLEGQAKSIFVALKSTREVLQIPEGQQDLECMEREKEDGRTQDVFKDDNRQ